MRTGLFFGSFNPIHVGHLIIASHLVSFGFVDRVWFVPSPHNPLKQKQTLLNEYERLAMVQLAVENDERLGVTDVEFHLPQPSYTIQTLIHLKEKYPTEEFSLIMGSDTVNTLHKWKNSEAILEYYRILVYLRPDHAVRPEFATHPAVTIIDDVPLMQISASYIRKLIKEDKPTDYLLTPAVSEYIAKWGFYR